MPRPSSCLTCAPRPSVCDGVAVRPGPADGLQRHCDGAAGAPGQLELPEQPRKGNKEHAASRVVRFNATHETSESDLLFFTVLVHLTGLHLLRPVWHTSSLTQSKRTRFGAQHL